MADGPGLLVLGADHHRTPVNVRERLAIPADQLPALGNHLRANLGVPEAVVVTTCNRLECYVTGNCSAEAVAEALGRHGGLVPGDWLPHGYIHRDSAAIRHLFRVASGLESLVIGEEQILGQVRDAYETARTRGWTGPLLNPLFQRALGVAKDVRTNTGISRHKLSIASVAVDLARQVHGDLRSARLLVVGAGEMAELAVRYLLEQGVHHIGIINRSQERALALADSVQAKAWSWDDLSLALESHDIVVSSTAAPHLVISKNLVAPLVARRRRPLIFIDLAVPRDIDPGIAELEDAFLYNIDHLESVVAANRQLRAEEVSGAEALVDAEVAGFLATFRPDVQSLATRISAWSQHLAQTEAARLAPRLATSDARIQDEARYAIERTTGKMAHRLHALVKAHPGDPQVEALIRELLDSDPTAKG